MLAVKKDGKTFWKGGEGWLVQDCLLADLDQKPGPELVLLLWKHGSYGNHLPFWVKANDIGWSQHIFIYSIWENRLKPIWMSSGLPFGAVSIKEGGNNPRFKGRSSIILVGLDGQETRWCWDYFGLRIIEEERREPNAVRFMAAGDNLIDVPIYDYGFKHGFGFLYEDIRGLISEADFAAVNLETILVDRPAAYGGYPHFGTPLEVGRELINAGFDIVTLANNHALDRGQYGIEVTSAFFESADAKNKGDGPWCLGVNRGRCGVVVGNDTNRGRLGVVAGNDMNRGRCEIVSKNGISIALFNYAYGLNGLDLSDFRKVKECAVNILPPLSDNPAYEELISDIGEARSRADFVILFVHWGDEYETQPNEFQSKWARVFLEAQVDAVIGTHPHAAQPCELIKDEKGHEMLVYYSLGNLISTQKDKACRIGVIADFTLLKEEDGSTHIGRHDSHRINSSFWEKISGVG